MLHCVLQCQSRTIHISAQINANQININNLNMIVSRIKLSHKANFYVIFLEFYSGLDEPFHFFHHFHAF